MADQPTQRRRAVLAVAIAQVLMITAPALLAQSAPADQQPKNTTENSQQDAKAASAQIQTLPTLTVTAERRAQNIQEVPISMSAFTAADINNRNILNITDLSGAAPSLVINKSAGGWMTNAEVAIRGGNVGVGTPVAVYLNGIYVGPASTYVFDLPDLQRVEILRGPQGTLYGGNALDGAINLITTTPSGTFTGNASLGYGRYNNQLGTAAIDLPALGKLKVSVGGRYSRQDGWVHVFGPQAAGNLGASTEKDGFVSLSLDATDDLNVSYRYDNSNTVGTTVFNQALSSNVQGQFGIPGIVVNGSRQDRASVNSPYSFHKLITSQGLTVTWKPSDATTLKYLLGHRNMGSSSGLDLDGSPILFAQNYSWSNYSQTSNELQYLGDVGRWNWVAGLYRLSNSSAFVNPQTFFLGAFRLLSTANTGNEDRAAYGQVTYKVTDALSATMGIRRTISEVNATASLTSGPAALVPPGTHAEATFSATTPMATLKYQFSPDSMAYFRYAKGFMGGGFNVQASTASGVRTPYDPETAQTFEIGTKNGFLGNRLQLDADVFYERVNNLQENIFTALNSATSTIVNAGKVNKYGFEMQGQWRATDDLTLGMTYSYLHAEYNEFMNRGVNVAKNRAFPLLPKNMFSLTVNDILWRTRNGFLRGTLDYRYTAGYYRYPDPLVAEQPGGKVAANTRIGSLSTLNGQLAFSGMSWWNGRLNGEVALWVQNITNTSHVYNKIDFGSSFGNLIVGNYNEPRTFGVKVSASW